jgi:SAM-dependent methyltransferase
MYETYLAPVIFEAYAPDIASRLAARSPGSALELAAGTGVVTRQLAAQLDAATSITATDLNPPMVEHARSLGAVRPVDWQQANAEMLPFDDASFDVVVCQFGVMFFDRATAFSDIYRVLRPGGAFVFNAWDRIETSEFADVLTQALAVMFPDDPPEFLRRTHGYHGVDRIRTDITSAGLILCQDRDDRHAQPPPRATCRPSATARTRRATRSSQGPDHLLEATDDPAALLPFSETDIDGVIRPRGHAVK